MNFVSKFIVLSLTTTCLGQPAFSIQVVNEARPKNVIAATTHAVERGGTVDAVNTDKKTMTVDGQNYRLTNSPVIVHAFGKDSQGVGSIRPGTKIRFNTTKNNYAGLDQIIEIWISETGKGPNKK